MVALLIAVCLLTYAIVRYYQYVARYPKGPLPLPFVGNYFDFDFKAIHKTFDRLGKEQKSAIYTVFTPVPYVQINDYQIVKEAFIDKGEYFTGRPTNNPVQQAFSFAPNSGVGNSNGDQWREQRRVALTILRDFGMGKNRLEEQIRSSIEDYIEYLNRIEDKDHVDIHWPCKFMTSNVINELLFGFRYKHEACEPLLAYVEQFTKVLEAFVDSKWIMLCAAFPILAKLPVVGWYAVGRMMDTVTKINGFIVSNAERALEGYNVEDEPTCFVQAYTQKIGKNEYFDRANMLTNCVDFFGAGLEPTTETLIWAILLLAKHTEMQEKLRQEVHSVVGRDRLPSMSDQSKLPYSRACVYEVQRFANILTTNVHRVTVQDVEIRGQMIPEGTWVNGDIHYLMANDPLFEHPEEFRPERYLAEDGTTIRKDLVDRTIPFSIGKRSCAGEGIARVELFLGLTATFQHFRISASPGKIIDLEPKSGVMLLPKSQNVRLEKI